MPSHSASAASRAITKPIPGTPSKHLLAEAASASNLDRAVRSRLAVLTPREEKILRMRFGIGERSEHTLEEVGRVYGLTRERIRQIEAKALTRLRGGRGIRALRDMAEQ